MSLSVEHAPLPAQVAPVHLPRITISFCTQCKWLLRAAYYAQELLSTFSTALGEVCLVPTTGGVFTVDIHYASPPSEESQEVHTTQLWDRTSKGGFPEVKQLKQLVRNIVEPGRDLGHVDHHNGKTQKSESLKQPTQSGEETSSQQEHSEIDEADLKKQ